MIVKLDRTRPDYQQQQLAELRRIAHDVGGEPRQSVTCFRTFEEFNEYKNIFHNRPPRSQVEDKQGRH